MSRRLHNKRWGNRAYPRVLDGSYEHRVGIAAAFALRVFAHGEVSFFDACFSAARAYAVTLADTERMAEALQGRRAA